MYFCSEAFQLAIGLLDEICCLVGDNLEDELLNKLEKTFRCIRLFSKSISLIVRKRVAKKSYRLILLLYIFIIILP